MADLPLPRSVLDADRSARRGGYVSPDAFATLMDCYRAAHEALLTAEPILALLHYRGLADTPNNRRDVELALAHVRTVLPASSTTTSASTGSARTAAGGSGEH